MTAARASHAQAARPLAAAPARRVAATAAQNVTVDQTVGVPSAQALARLEGCWYVEQDVNLQQGCLCFEHLL